MYCIVAHRGNNMAYYMTNIVALKVGDTILLDDKPTCVMDNLDYGDHTEVSLLVAVDHPDLSVGSRVAWSESYKSAANKPGYHIIAGVRRSMWNNNNIYFLLQDVVGEYLSCDIKIMDKSQVAEAASPPMSEGDALMKFFAAAPGTWEGYSDDT